ncbi:MAG: tetratricopeptide repeat protein [Pseudomonadota bacterium]|nr:tetratricopeptide repeat protein [Pseudomonadota bacterium]
MRRLFKVRLGPRFALAMAAACTLATASASASAACTFGLFCGDKPDQPTHEIRDPHYGDALFYFFSDRYFTSLTTLMASQHFNRVEHHSDEAEVLRGGMLASYGLTKEAGEIFTQLIQRGASPAVRDRAWFYLAKIRYQRGYLPEAEEAIAHVENHLPPDLQEEYGLLLANLLMARADYAGAAGALKPLTDKSWFGRTIGSRYVRYNLGIALLKSGESKRGTEMLEAVGKESAPNEEFRSLRDRANVALGFSALTENRPQDARVYLERVRLQGLQSSKALLGFGWAADALKDPKLALVPWTELAQRDNGDTAVLEAQIAVPYAYAELGAYGQALERYEGAISAFERESADLQDSIKAIRSGNLIEQLVDQNPGEEMGWFWNISALPNMPHARHLAQVLAQHEFQESLKNYRDLRFLQRNLDEWRDKLVAFNDMLATRRKAFADRLPMVLERQQKTGLDALVQRREGVAAEISQGEAAGDGVVFADAKQLELLGRLKDIHRIADDPNADPEIVKTRDRVRLVSGVMSWQLAQDGIDRIWKEKKELQDIDAALVDAQRRVAALAQAQKDEPVRFDRFAQRIAAISPLLQVMIPRVAGLGKEQRTEAQDIAIAELSSQQERIAGYTTQARFALAQLYDRAYGKKDAADAAQAKP